MKTILAGLLQRLENFPMMAKGIDYPSEPVAITLVGHGVNFSGAGMNGLARNRVGIFYL